MIDDIIKRIVIAAIESFPINAEKKTKLLQKIMERRNIEEAETDVL